MSNKMRTMALIVHTDDDGVISELARLAAYSGSASIRVLPGRREVQLAFEMLNEITHTFAATQDPEPGEEPAPRKDPPPGTPIAPPTHGNGAPGGDNGNDKGNGNGRPPQPEAKPAEGPIHYEWFQPDGAPGRYRIDLRATLKAMNMTADQVIAGDWQRSTFEQRVKQSLLRRRAGASAHD